jgi:hypothetical protein
MSFRDITRVYSLKENLKSNLKIVNLLFEPYSRLLLNNHYEQMPMSVLGTSTEQWAIYRLP